MCRFRCRHVIVADATDWRCRCASAASRCVGLTAAAAMRLRASSHPPPLQAFRAMQNGFSSGAFRFTILIAETPTVEQM